MTNPTPTMTRLKVNSTPEDFSALLMAELPFRVSYSLWALSGASQSTGDMPDHYANAYLSTRVSYTVYSYLTPIAWRLDSGPWIMPDLRYSVTTSKAQSKIFAAIRLIGG